MKEELTQSVQCTASAIVCVIVVVIAAAVDDVVVVDTMVLSWFL
jgi:hypothetical protein